MATIEQVKQSLAELNNAIGQKNAEITAFNTAVRQRVNAIKDVITGLKRLNADAINRLRDIEQQLAAANAELERTKTQLDAVNGQNQQLNQRVNDLQQEIDRLNRERGATVQDIAEIAETIRNIRAQVDAIVPENPDLIRELTALEEILNRGPGANGGPGVGGEARGGGGPVAGGWQAQPFVPSEERQRQREAAAVREGIPREQWDINDDNFHGGRKTRKSRKTRKTKKYSNKTKKNKFRKSRKQKGGFLADYRNKKPVVYLYNNDKKKDKKNDKKKDKKDDKKKKTTSKKSTTSKRSKSTISDSNSAFNF